MDNGLFESLRQVGKDRLNESQDRTKMVIEMQVTQAQGLALQAMFEHWNYLAGIGGSRKIGFYVDGDGNFKPDCQIAFESNVELTDEMRDISIVEDNNGDRTYDFDPIGWMLDKKEHIN